ncbi:MAG: right-handed parallel beta-helix repeat-containing protein, partial [Candidatus Moraniibacteriota bacterium]
SEEGTSAHPYQSIKKALDHAKGGTEVRVKNGDYKENITIPKDVKVVADSEDRDKVTIKAHNEKKPVVVMKDGAELSYVTVKNGNYGVHILSDARAHLYNVVVKNNSSDGIHIESASVDKRHRVIIDTVEVTRNGRAGIFSEKRSLTILDSYMTLNKSDGTDLAGGTEAWLESTSFSGNKGSGLKLTLDGSSISGKKNNIRSNAREGVEINSRGASGSITFQKDTIVKNGRFGIARVARTAAGYNFGGLVYGSGVNVNKIDQNGLGSISRVIGQ